MMRFPLPVAMSELPKLEGPPSEPKDAATVVLVRDGDAGLEAYLMRRQRSMAFAAGMYVFPGGRVDEADSHAHIPWVGPSPAEWAQRFGCSEDLARALVCAGVRETFEESGVLLAGANGDSVVADTGTPELLQARQALEAHEMTFSAFLIEAGLSLRTDLLGAWATWITPEIEPRRYDTKFFVAALPEGQSVGHLSGESDSAVWAPLTDVLAAVESGAAAMMPVTQMVCRQVSRLTADTIVDVARQRPIDAVTPVLVEIDGGLYLEVDLPESA